MLRGRQRMLIYSVGTSDSFLLLVPPLGQAVRSYELRWPIQQTRYLHLATHGLVDESDAVAWSSLALTQPLAPTPDDFGFLTLNDLFQNWWGKLSATELVVLSACDSQRGRLAGVEGVFGMPWGFMYAGSPAVIASLWQVDDASTAELMGNLYAEIHRISAEGAGESEAAKLAAFVAVRRALRRMHRHPYYWAPFIYLGDPR